jgi:putative hydrolase of HD superfamily
LASLAEFWRFGAGLKEEERRGWRKLGLKRVESVADHSYGVALLALIEAERRGYDLGMVVKLALIHDLEEAIMGDLTPADKKMHGIAWVRRHKRRAVKELVNALPMKSRASYEGLWNDLISLRTPEARLVHQLDKLEMALQAREYAKRIGRGKVVDFYRSAAKEIKDPYLRRVLRSVIVSY